MKKRSWDWLLIPLILIPLWAILFTYSLYFADGTKIGMTLFGILAWGNLAGLFLAIPLSVVCLIARAKGRFSKKASAAVVPLSFLNILVGIANWIFCILIGRNPW